MNWNSPADFLAMGGYGFYVWGAYAVTLACMLIDPILAARRLRRAASLLPPSGGGRDGGPQARSVQVEPPPQPSPDGGGSLR